MNLPVFSEDTGPVGEERPGHKLRYHWRERTLYHDGPPQRRKVALVYQKPRYDDRFSATIPKSYETWWYLECGHRVLPQRRYDAKGWKPYPEGYFDPEEAEMFCETCQRNLATREKRRYKEWYWDDGHVCIQNICQTCRQCMECKGHKRACTQSAKDYLMEMIFMDIPAFEGHIDTLRDNVEGIVDLLTKKQLEDAIEVYNDYED